MNRSLLYAILGISVAAFPIVRREVRVLTPVELAFTAADGSQVDMTALRGKVVLIDFWATWCHGCMEEMPSVVRAYNDLHSQGLEVVGVSLDIDRAAMESVMREKGIVWPQYFDGKAWDNEVAKRFAIRSIPTMLLLDKNGRIAEVVDMDGANGLESKITKLLAEK